MSAMDLSLAPIIIVGSMALEKEETLVIAAIVNKAANRAHFMLLVEGERR
jgi:hypothetical protein